jgi:hypothetical protein
LKVYADSSFLASLYTLDSHSARAAADVLRYNPKLMLTPLAELELTNALELRVFRKELSAAMIGEARAELQNHVNEGFYDVVGMPATAYDLARRIALRRTAATGTRHFTCGQCGPIACGRILDIRCSPGQGCKSRRPAIALKCGILAYDGGRIFHLINL